MALMMIKSNKQVVNKRVRYSMREYSYSKNEFLNQLIALRDKLDDTIDERELKAKSMAQKPDNPFINQLNKTKRRRFLVEELIQSVQKVDESDFLSNNGVYIEKFESLQTQS